eukprot:1381240-Lingulodinium_polyedra.AAC.1
MSNLWNKLKRNIGGSTTSESVKSEWDSICSKAHRSGKVELKNKAMILQLAFPKDWEDRWVHEVRKISNVKSK